MIKAAHPWSPAAPSTSVSSSEVVVTFTSAQWPPSSSISPRRSHQLPLPVLHAVPRELVLNLVASYCFHVFFIFNESGSCSVIQDGFELTL